MNEPPAPEGEQALQAPSASTWSPRKWITVSAIAAAVVLIVAVVAIVAVGGQPGLASTYLWVGPNDVAATCIHFTNQDSSTYAITGEALNSSGTSTLSGVAHIKGASLTIGDFTGTADSALSGGSGAATIRNGSLAILDNSGRTAAVMKAASPSQCAAAMSGVQRSINAIAHTQAEQSTVDSAGQAVTSAITQLNNDMSGLRQEYQSFLTDQQTFDTDVSTANQDAATNDGACTGNWYYDLGGLNDDMGSIDGDGKQLQSDANGISSDIRSVMSAVASYEAAHSATPHYVSPDTPATMGTSTIKQDEAQVAEDIGQFNTKAAADNSTVTGEHQTYNAQLGPSCPLLNSAPGGVAGTAASINTLTAPTWPSGD